MYIHIYSYHVSQQFQINQIIMKCNEIFFVHLFQCKVIKLTKILLNIAFWHIHFSCLSKFVCLRYTYVYILTDVYQHKWANIYYSSKRFFTAFQIINRLFSHSMFYLHFCLWNLQKCFMCCSFLLLYYDIYIRVRAFSKTS